MISVNSSPPSAAYMRRWIKSVLVQIMACRLSAPSHYLNQCWVIVNWTLGNKFQWNFNQNTKLFIHENASENVVCEMAVILSRGKWVKVITHPYPTTPTPIFCHTNKLVQRSANAMKIHASFKRLFLPAVHLKGGSLSWCNANRVSISPSKRNW